jgi:extracellular factor (EF) 3-hydroxypalmitic acid methyl ester biosynthesis protein
VRNRKRYFLDLLRRYLASSDRPVVRVLSVGSGPARECLEFFNSGHPGASRVFFDLVDQDPRALAYARTLNAAHAGRIAFHCCKAHQFRSAEKFDFVWSAGLFDYLPDRSFTALAGHLFRLLQPDGLLTIGNFDPSNPTRDYMEFAEWRLNYRTREDLYRLAFNCKSIKNVNQLCVDSESEHVNLFLHIARRAV